MNAKQKTRILNLSDSALDETVQIQGTMYDRKRAMTDSDVKQAAKMLAAGKSVTSVARTFGVSTKTIHYNTDAVYREKAIAKMSGKHTGMDLCDFEDRVSYKRALVEDNAKVIIR